MVWILEPPSPPQLHIYFNKATPQILPKQLYQLRTKHSTMKTYGDHPHENHHICSQFEAVGYLMKTETE